MKTARHAVLPVPPSLVALSSGILVRATAKKSDEGRGEGIAIMKGLACPDVHV